LGFRTFGFGSGRILDCLISGHLGFQDVRVRIGSDFRLSDLGSSRVSVSFGFGSGRVSDCLISDHLGFQVIRVQIGSGSGQFDFLKKSGRVRFGSVLLSEKIKSSRTNFSSGIEFCHL
jgi:hypothetical protein